MHLFRQFQEISQNSKFGKPETSMIPSLEMVIWNPFFSDAPPSKSPSQMPEPQGQTKMPCNFWNGGFGESFCLDTLGGVQRGFTFI